MAKNKTEEGSQFTLYFGPILDALRSLGGSGTPAEVVERVAADLNIPDDVQNELLPSGESRFRNQVAWARNYLADDGLLDRSKRGVWSLTERGRVTHLTREQAQEIRRHWVKLYTVSRKLRAGTIGKQADDQTAEDPAEPVANHRNRVIQLMHALPASGFERFCQRILRLY